MLWTKLKAATLLLAGTALIQQGRAEQPADPPKTPETAPRTAKQDLTPETLAKLHAVIRPHDNEWRHLHVQWLTDVVAARKKAVAEDKPIIILYNGGAGYNDSLGIC